VDWTTETFTAEEDSHVHRCNAAGEQYAKTAVAALSAERIMSEGRGWHAERENPYATNTVCGQGEQIHDIRGVHWSINEAELVTLQEARNEKKKMTVSRHRFQAIVKSGLPEAAATPSQTNELSELMIRAITKTLNSTKESDPAV
jgi:uncharacterized protein YPO0396